MIRTIRNTFGPVLVGTIIGLIALVFVFYGVFTPKNQGVQRVAGSVNGDNITMAEFNRALEQRMEFFRGMKLSEEQLKTFRLHESVFQELVNRKLLIQEAQRSGRGPSDEEIRDRIREFPAFQKDGKFDKVHYKEILSANGYTPSSFESMIRDNLLVEQMRRSFRQMVRVSPSEVEKELQLAQHQLGLGYVLITTEAMKKALKIEPKEIAAFLSDAERQKRATSLFDLRQNTQYKGKKFDDVKSEIAQEILRSEKTAEARKMTDDLATKVLAMLEAGKNEKAVGDFLKPYGVNFQKSGLINPRSTFLTGMAEADAKPILRDAFSQKSVLDPKQGGKPKKYSTPAGTIVAVVLERPKSDALKVTDAEREKVYARLSNEKERELFGQWIRKLNERAKIKRNLELGNPTGETEDS